MTDGAAEPALVISPDHAAFRASLGPRCGGSRINTLDWLPVFAVMSVSGDPDAAQITLVTRLAALIEAIAELRDAQRHAAQAAAARRAAEGLYAARGTRTRPPKGHGPARTAVGLAGLDFPFPPALVPADRSASPGAPRPAPSSPRPSRGAGPPGRRGPAR